MRLVYQEHKMDVVMRYFIDSFSGQPGESIFSIEWFYDPHKGVAVFKFWVKEEEKEASNAAAIFAANHPD